MKRILVTLLTVALAGSLMFMGTAAAQEIDTGIDEFEPEQDAETDQEATNTGEIDQDQLQVNANGIEGSTGDAPLVQFNNVNQENDGTQAADITQETEQESETEQETEDVAGTSVDTDPIDIEVDLPPVLGT